MPVETNRPICRSACNVEEESAQHDGYRPTCADANHNPDSSNGTPCAHDNATGNAMVNLRRVNVSSGTSDLMASASTVENSTAIQEREDLTITYPDVLYPDYAYYVTTCLNYADHRLYSVRISYSSP